MTNHIRNRQHTDDGYCSGSICETCGCCCHCLPHPCWCDDPDCGCTQEERQ